MFAANFEEKTAKHAIDWSARKVRSSERDVVLTPELEAALRQLRLELENAGSGDGDAPADSGTESNPDVG